MDAAAPNAIHRSTTVQLISVRILVKLLLWLNVVRWRPFQLFFSLFFFKFDFHVCVQWFWLTWRGSCTTDLNGPALTRCASRKSSRWLNPVVRPCLTDAYWRLHTTLRAVSVSNRDVATCWRETSAPVNLGSICVILFTTGIVWRPSSAKVSVVSINADAIARYNIQTNSKL